MNSDPTEPQTGGESEGLPRVPHVPSAGPNATPDPARRQVAGEPYFQTIVESIEVAVYACDAQGRLTFFNAALAALWGESPELGKPLRSSGEDSVLAPDGRPMRPEEWPMMRAIYQGQIIRDQEVILVRPDGARRHILPHPQPQYDADGKLVGAVNMLVDITPLRQAEASQHAAQSSARAILDSLRGHICVIDEHGVLINTNLAWRQFATDNLGHGAQVSEGADYLAVCDRAAAAGVAGVAELAAGLRAVLSGRLARFDAEYDCHSPEQKRWFSCRIKPLLGSRPQRIVVSHTDITDLKLAEQKRAEVEARLHEAQKLELVGALASSIAHDFNNVVGAVLGHAALAGESLAPGQAASFHLEQIRKAGMRARSLVQRMLSIGRPQAEAMACRWLKPLIEEEIELLRATLPSGVSIESRLCDEALSASIDVPLLSQVIMNLGINAWHALRGATGTVQIGLERASPPGADAVPPTPTPTPTPTTTTTDAPAWAHLWVRDNGSGMEDAVRTRVFEPFFSTKPVSAGSGLGLTGVKRIVESHGGVIEVESAPGQGSCVHVWLPLAEMPDATPVAAAASVGTAQAPSGEPAARVLYIDDDETVSVLVAALLPLAGMRVRCFEDAALAMATLRADPAAFDIVVTDYNMPRRSGLDVAREAAAIRSDLPVVLITGHVDDALMREATAAGVRGVVHKESTFEDLGPELWRVLQADQRLRQQRGSTS